MLHIHFSVSVSCWLLVIDSSAWRSLDLLFTWLSRKANGMYLIRLVVFPYSSSIHAALILVYGSVGAMLWCARGLLPHLGMWLQNLTFSWRYNFQQQGLSTIRPHPLAVIITMLLCFTNAFTAKTNVIGRFGPLAGFAFAQGRFARWIVCVYRMAGDTFLWRWSTVIVCHCAVNRDVSALLVTDGLSFDAFFCIGTRMCQNFLYLFLICAAPLCSTCILIPDATPCVHRLELRRLASC